MIFLINKVQVDSAQRFKSELKNCNLEKIEIKKSDKNITLNKKLGKKYMYLLPKIILQQNLNHLSLK